MCEVFAATDTDVMERVGISRCMVVAVSLAAAATAAVATWIAFRIGGGQATLWVDDLVTPAAAVLACLSCIRARGRALGRMRSFWLTMGCATALWTAAEITWGVYVLLLDQEVPSPSWADIGYLAAVMAVVIALVVHPAMRTGGVRTVRSLLDGIGVAGALVFLSWTFVLGPLWRETDLTTAGGVVTVAYPFGDIVLVFVVVLAIRRVTATGHAPGQASLWWLLIAMFLLAFSDSVYTYLAEAASYQSMSAHLIDAGWIAAYLAIALAAHADGGYKAREPEIASLRPSAISVVAPLVLVLAALTAAAIRIEIGARIDTAGWIMALALVVIVLLRQGFVIAELLGAPAKDWATRGRSVAVGASLARRATVDDQVRP